MKKITNARAGRAPSSHRAGRPSFDRPLRHELLEDRRLLATITVGNLFDVVNGVVTSPADLIANPGADGISLREAILAANATSEPDAIEFAPALTSGGPATLQLALGQLQIDNSLVITGPGANLLTIDGQNLSRIIDGSPGSASLEISGLRLTRGRAPGGQNGGAIRWQSSGTLTVHDAVIESNAAGDGVATTGGSGGGIWGSGPVTLVNATVRDNKAGKGGVVAGGPFGAVGLNGGSGGGVWTSGALVVNGSTISENQTGLGGEGDLNQGLAGDGGGIFSSTGSVTLTNATISTNRAFRRGGGVFVASGHVSIDYSTVAFNVAVDAGGVAAAGASALISVHSSILASNANGDAANLAGATAGIQSLGYNVVQTGNALSAFAAYLGDRTIFIDPLLGPLADNGGPTRTHSLLPGSVAINAGDPNAAPGADGVPMFDQRGPSFSRVVGRIDVGAFESSLAPLLVNTLVDEADGSITDGDVSLRDALALAPAGAHIGFSVTGVINLSPALGELVAAKSLTIDGPGANLLTIDAQRNSRVLRITADVSDFVIMDVTLTGGMTTGDGADFSGGALHSNVTNSLALLRTTVSNSSTTGHFAMGGGIYSTGILTLTDSLVTGNLTAGRIARGGGIYVTNHVELLRSVVSGNGTLSNSPAVEPFIDSPDGGGIASHGSVTLTQSTVSGNATFGSLGDGGGIFAEGAVTLTQSTVSNNSVLGYGASGGGIYALGAVTLTNSTISGNSTSGATGTSEFGVEAHGGGIFAKSAVTIQHSTITNNHAHHATAHGGGVYQADRDENFPFSISGSIIAGNTAGGEGPDLKRDPGTALAVVYSLIGNTSGAGLAPGVGVGNLFDVDPLLGPLADNGGPTQTHALLVTFPPFEPPKPSPAINAGNPALMAGVGDTPLYDQRGFPYTRVAGGRIDIGAFERQIDPSADFDVDGDVDGFDFLAWQRGFGLTGAAATLAAGNADNDNDVDGVDLAIWKLQFGQAAAVVASESSAALAATAPPSALTPQAVDAAMAYLNATDAPSRPLFRPRLLKRQ